MVAETTPGKRQPLVAAVVPPKALKMFRTKSQSGPAWAKTLNSKKAKKEIKVKGESLLKRIFNKV
jgi:hypothetical protein